MDLVHFQMRNGIQGDAFLSKTRVCFGTITRPAVSELVSWQYAEKMASIYIALKYITCIIPFHLFIFSFLLVFNEGSLIVFDGLCRDGSGKRDWLNAITKKAASECWEECDVTSGCVAFSYKTEGEINCYLYQKGPYTHGTGKKNTKCYVMNTK